MFIIFWTAYCFSRWTSSLHIWLRTPDTSVKESRHLCIMWQVSISVVVDLAIRDTGVVWLQILWWRMDTFWHTCWLVKQRSHSSWCASHLRRVLINSCCAVALGREVDLLQVMAPKRQNQHETLRRFNTTAILFFLLNVSKPTTRLFAQKLKSTI